MKGKAKWSLFLALVFVLSMFLAACSGGGDDSSGGSKSGDGGNKGDGGEQLADDQTFHLLDSAEIPSLDVAHATDSTSFNVLQMTRAGLTRIHHGKTIFDAAAGEPKVNDDQTQYTFTLRDGLKWSDGTPVTADDFVYEWHREVDPKTAAEYASIFVSANIKNADKILSKDSDMYGKVDQLGIKAVDDKTIQVTLDKATPYFVSLMSFPAFFPTKKDMVEKQGKDYATEADKQLYNGPFVLAKWDHGNGWTYKKNDKYWDKENITLDTVDVKVIKEVSTAVNLYQTGQLDYTGLTAEFIDQFKDSKDLETSATAGVFFIRLNQDHRPELKNKNLRQALSMSIDRKGMTDVILNDGSTPAHYIVPKEFAKGPDGKDFRASAPDGYLIGSKEEAKKKWEKAKQDLGIDKLELEYMTSDSDTASKMAEYIANQISKNLDGVTVKITKLPWKTYLKREDAGNYDMAESGWLPDYQDPMTYLDMWVTDGPFNRTGWGDKKYDEMIKKAKNMGTEPAKRWALMQDAEKYLISAQPFIPLFQDGAAHLIKPYVKDFYVESYGPEFDFYSTKILKH